jgi:hypothetical protein
MGIDSRLRIREEEFLGRGDLREAESGFGGGRPLIDRRATAKGLRRRQRAGAPSCDVPEQYGSRNSIWRCSDAGTSVVVGATTMAENNRHMIHRMIVHGNSQAPKEKGVCK